MFLAFPEILGFWRQVTATAIGKTGFLTFAAATGYIIGERMFMLTKKSWRKRKTEMPEIK